MSERAFPPELPSRYRSRRKSLILLWSAIGLASVILLTVGPSVTQGGILPPCQLKQMTGLECPGCGGTRSTLAFAQFDWTAAFKYHPLWFITLLYLLIVLIGETVLVLRRRPPLRWFPSPLIWSWAAALLIFAVIRNLPGLEFMRP